MTKFEQKRLVELNKHFLKKGFSLKGRKVYWPPEKPWKPEPPDKKQDFYYTNKLLGKDVYDITPQIVKKIQQAFTRGSRVSIIQGCLYEGVFDGSGNYTRDYKQYEDETLTFQSQLDKYKEDTKLWKERERLVEKYNLQKQIAAAKKLLKEQGIKL